jgi:hypothetical protein
MYAKYAKFWVLEKLAQFMGLARGSGRAGEGMVREVCEGMFANFAR